MQYFYTNEKGEKEEVAVEKFMWGVIYKDDREMLQFDPAGIFHRIGEIDQAQVKTFVLIGSFDRTRRIDIAVPEGARLIHKYRHFRLNVGTPQYREVKVYIFGIKHQGHYFYNFVLPDGRIVQSIDEDLQLTNFDI